MTKPYLELILTGDLNYWDILWGSDKITSYSRQDESQLIVNFMANLDLQLLFSQRTITYTGATRLGNAASTIDSIFSSTCLAEDRILCTNLDIDHGSDHAAIQIVFTMATPELLFASPRWLFKSAPSNKICQTVTENIHLVSDPSIDIDAYANQLLRLCKYQLIRTFLWQNPAFIPNDGGVKI